MADISELVTGTVVIIPPGTDMLRGGAGTYTLTTGVSKATRRLYPAGSVWMRMRGEDGTPRVALIHPDFVHVKQAPSPAERIRPGVA